MHAAKLSKSERLIRVLALLKDRRWHSTWEIMQKARVCAVNSIAAELRANGKAIVCKQRYTGRAMVWEYRLG